jgi:hypothetical protein
MHTPTLTVAQATRGFTLIHGDGIGIINGNNEM